VPEMTVSMMKISSGKIQNFQHSNYSLKELHYEDFQINELNEKNSTTI
jgi:hypothetical protein